MRFLCTIILLLSLGCDRADSPPTELRLGYFANLTHAQAVLAVSTGELQQSISPLIVSPKIFNAGPSLIEALFAGEIDIGYVGPGPVLSANERTAGRGIRVIAGAAANGVVIVARQDSSVHTLADLAHAKLATPQHGNTQDIAARHYLRHVLKQSDLSNIIPISNAEQPAMMARGQIDAAWVPEPWGARLIAENNARLIAEEKDLWPDKQFALTCVVTTPEFLAAHPDLVEKVLAVHAQWTTRLQSNPDQYVPQLGQALRSLTGKSLPPGTLESAIQRVTFTTDPLPSTFATLGQWSYDLGLLRRDPRLDRLVDTTILHKLTPATQPTGTP